MEVVDQFAAEFEIELVLESRGPLADGGTLLAEISVVVESDLNDLSPLPVVLCPDALSVMLL